MTEERKIQIPITADNQTKAGFDSVKQGAREMAQAVQQSGAQAAKGVDGVGAATEKLSAQQGRFIELVKRKSIGLTEGAAGLAQYRAAQLGVADAAAPYIAKIRQAEQGTVQLGMSAKATAAAMRGVPAQFTDIFTALQGGQAPLTVFLQQGGQLKDMFGGIGPAARALGGYVAGLINPFTVAAAAVGVLTVAYLQGSKEARAFDNALTASGNAIGITSSRFAQLRDNLVGVAGTRSKAAEALTEIANAGVFTSGSVMGIAEAAILMEKATGQAISKTVDQFKELAKSPADASAKLNEQYNYLTVAVYRQIKALEDQGRAVDAANLAEKTYADALAARGRQIVENVGYIEAKFRSLAFYAKKGWDAVVDIGRAETGGEQLASLKKRAAMLEGNGVRVPASGPTSYAEADLARTRAQIALLERLNGAQEKQTAAVAERSALEKLGIQFAKDGEQYKNKAKKLEEEITKARIEGQKLVNAGIITEAQLTERLNGIREKYKESGSAGVGQSEVAGIVARTKQQRQYLKELQDQLASGDFSGLTKLTEGEKLVIKIQEELKTSINGVARAQKEKALAAAMVQAEVDKQVASQERQNKAVQEARETIEKQVDAVGRQAEAIRSQAEGQEFANQVMGKSKAAVEEMVLAQLKKQAAEAADTTTTSPAYLAALNAKIAAQQRYVDALTASEKKLGSVKVAEAALAASDYLQGLRERVDLDFQKARVGSAEGDRLEGRAAIEARLIQEANLRERELAKGLISKPEYDEYLALARQTYSEELRIFEDRTLRMKVLAADGLAGATKALQNYAQESADIFAQTERATTNAFKGMEDALVSFATTGKLSFKDLANSIIADIARMVIKSQITGPLAGYLNGLMGGGGAGVNFNVSGADLDLFYQAKGGVWQTPGLSAYSNKVVNKPTMFAFAKGAGLMGEAGPEAIMPLKRGPDGRLGVEAASGGGGGNVVNIYVTTTDTVSKTELEAKLRDSQRQMVGALDRQQRYGRG